MKNQGFKRFERVYKYVYAFTPESEKKWYRIMKYFILFMLLGNVLIIQISGFDLFLENMFKLGFIVLLLLNISMVEVFGKELEDREPLTDEGQAEDQYGVTIS